MNVKWIMGIVGILLTAGIVAWASWISTSTSQNTSDIRVLQATVSMELKALNSNIERVEKVITEIREDQKRRERRER